MGNPEWTQATQWLLGAGVIMGLLAAVFGLIDLFGEARIRALTEVWWHATGNVLAVLISIANFYIRFTVEFREEADRQKPMNSVRRKT